MWRRRLASRSRIMQQATPHTLTRPGTPSNHALKEMSNIGILAFDILIIICGKNLITFCIIVLETIRYWFMSNILINVLKECCRWWLILDSTFLCNRTRGTAAHQPWTTQHVVSISPCHCPCVILSPHVPVSKVLTDETLGSFKLGCFYAWMLGVHLHSRDCRPL